MSVYRGSPHESLARGQSVNCVRSSESRNETTFTVGATTREPVMIAAADFRTECPMALRALIMTALLAIVCAQAAAAGPNGAQERGAEQFLAAVASGNAQ